MELTTEQITDLGITEENIPKINTFLSEQIATAKQGFEGKANNDAEAILTGASKKIADDTNIQRNQGEKVGDYFTRAWGEFNQSKLSEVSGLKNDYESKIKDFKGDKDLVSKITNLESEKDTLLQKYADFDTIKSKAEKYDPLFEKYETTKIQVAFNSVKPNFPDTVNPYEAKAKWNEFKNGVLDKYTIEIIDGDAKAISKENQYDIKSLSDLASTDAMLIKLSEGRQQSGTGSQQTNLMDVEGVPFQVPDNIDNETKTKLIKEYLTKQGLNSMSPEWSKKFAEINKAIINKKA